MFIRRALLEPLIQRLVMWQWSTLFKSQTIYQLPCDFFPAHSFWPNEWDEKACPLSSVTLWWKVFGMSPCEIAYNVMVVTNAVGFEFCSSINLTNLGTIISGKNFGLRQIHIPFISCLTLNCFLPSVRSLRFFTWAPESSQHSPKKWE